VERKKKAAARPGGSDPAGGENVGWGARGAKRSALFVAKLNAVHAGGEPGWSSDHLEPFSF